MVQEHRNSLLDRRTRPVGRRILSSGYRLEVVAAEVDCIHPVLLAPALLVALGQIGSVGCSWLYISSARFKESSLNDGVRYGCALELPLQVPVRLPWGAQTEN